MAGYERYKDDPIRDRDSSRHGSERGQERGSNRDDEGGGWFRGRGGGERSRGSGGGMFGSGGGQGGDDWSSGRREELGWGSAEGGRASGGRDERNWEPVDVEPSRGREERGWFGGGRSQGEREERSHPDERDERSRRDERSQRDEHDERGRDERSQRDERDERGRGGPSGWGGASGRGGEGDRSSQERGQQRGRDYGYDDRHEGLPIDETSRLIASNKVEGTAVYSRTGARLGSIYNFMVDKRSGKAEYAVMTYGGFLGMGTRYYPMPWDLLEYDTRLGGYRVDMTERDLERAPSFDRDSEPKFDQRYGERVRGWYGLKV